MDEPSEGLTPTLVDRLLATVAARREREVGILLVVQKVDAVLRTERPLRLQGPGRSDRIEVRPSRSRRDDPRLGMRGHAVRTLIRNVGTLVSGDEVPLHFRDAAFVRTHFDAMEVRLPDAPKPNEILVALVVTDGGRPHPRVGGLTVGEAKKEDGLR